MTDDKTETDEPIGPVTPRGAEAGAAVFADAPKPKTIAKPKVAKPKTIAKPKDAKPKDAKPKGVKPKGVKPKAAKPKAIAKPKAKPPMSRAQKRKPSHEPASAAEHFKGVLEEFAGSVKSQVGHLFDNKELEAEGKLQERHGRARQKPSG